MKTMPSRNWYVVERAKHQFSRINTSSSELSKHGNIIVGSMQDLADMPEYRNVFHAIVDYGVSLAH